MFWRCARVSHRNAAVMYVKLYRCVSQYQPIFEPPNIQGTLSPIENAPFSRAYFFGWTAGSFTSLRLCVPPRQYNSTAPSSVTSSQAPHRVCDLGYRSEQAKV